MSLQEIKGDKYDPLYLYNSIEEMSQIDFSYFRHLQKCLLLKSLKYLSLFLQVEENKTITKYFSTNEHKILEVYIMKILKGYIKNFKNIH